MQVESAHSNGWRSYARSLPFRTDSRDGNAVPESRELSTPSFTPQAPAVHDEHALGPAWRHSAAGPPCLETSTELR